MVLWWCNEAGMEPKTGVKLSCETGDANPAMSRIAAARPTLTIVFDDEDCCVCSVASFAASIAVFGFLGVFCREDMIQKSISFLHV